MSSISSFLEPEVKSSWTIPPIITKHEVRNWSYNTNEKDAVCIFVASNPVEEIVEHAIILQRTCISMNLRCFDAFLIILEALADFHTTVS